MDLHEIIKQSKLLKPKSQQKMGENLFHLIDQIESSVILEGPYRLVLDSNIIMRLESYRQGVISEGLLSILLAFMLIKRLPYRFDMVVRPTVFYEYLRQKNLTSSHEHWRKFKELKDLVEEELGSKLFFDGIETYQGAEHYLNLIQSDSDKITTTLRSYQQKNWKFNFIQQAGCGFTGMLSSDARFVLIPPAFAAEALYVPMSLDYFDERKSSRFFIEYIEKNLIECERNDKEFIAKYNSKEEFLFTRILKLSPKGNLVGLADLDIYSTCNINNQFSDQSHSRYAPASAALTIDRNLALALRRSTSHHITSGEIVGGPDNADDFDAKMDAFKEEHKRIRESEKRHRIACEATKAFMEELLANEAFEAW